MATELEELLIQLKADSESFRSELKSSQSALNKATDSMTAAVNEFSKKSEGGFKASTVAFGSFVGVLASAAVQKGFQLLVNGFKSVVSDGIDAAIEAEKFGKQLDNAFALAGRSADGSSGRFKEFADELGRTTQFEDDVIVQTGAMIESLARLDEDGLKRATQGAIDFAAATGRDLSTVAVAVGKAASGNTRALAAMGIQLEDTGDKAKNTALVLATLEARFSGSATNTVKTFSGALAQAHNAFTNTTEAIGNMVVKNPVVVAGIGAVARVFQELTQYISENEGSIKQFVGQGLIYAVNTFGVLSEVLSTVVRLWQTQANAVMLVGQAYVDTFQAIKAAASGDFSGAAAAFDETKQRFDDLKKGLSGPGLFDSITQSAADVGFAMGQAFGKDPTGKTLKGVKDITEELTRAQEAAKAFGESLVKKGSDPLDDFTLRSDLLKASREADLITEQQFLAEKAILMQDQFELENRMLMEARATSLQTEADFQLAEAQLRQEQASRAIALGAEKAKAEQNQNKLREENLKSSLGTIATLQNSSSKELANIGRASAVATATMDGFVAIQKALAAAPPPFGFALAALVGAASAANIAKISGVQLASGIDSVPGIGNRDSVPAMLTPGERVVPKNTNQDLKEFLGGQNSEPKNQITNNFTFYGIDPSNADGIIKVVNDGISRGALPLLVGR